MVRPYRDRRPAVADSAYIDPSAQVIGDVAIGERANIWCNVTIRADVHHIRIGDETNVQDNTCLHVDYDKPTILGERVTIGHSCTIHGCEIGDDCLIGMGATVLSGAKIGKESLVAAGSLVLEGQEIPARSVVMGSPAKVRRQVSDEDLEKMRDNAQRYVGLGREYGEQS